MILWSMHSEPQLQLCHLNDMRTTRPRHLIAAYEPETLENRMWLHLDRSSLSNDDNLLVFFTHRVYPWVVASLVDWCAKVTFSQQCRGIFYETKGATRQHPRKVLSKSIMGQARLEVHFYKLINSTIVHWINFMCSLRTCVWLVWIEAGHVSEDMNTTWDNDWNGIFWSRGFIECTVGFKQFIWRKRVKETAEIMTDISDIKITDRFSLKDRNFLITGGGLLILEHG